jgi:monoamine oxidase
MKSLQVEVAVVGAGLAGLVAARQLVRSGIDCAVLEAGVDVGGRTRNGRLGDELVDLGGTFVSRDQERVVALAEELGLTLTPTYCRGENVILWRGRRRRYAGMIPRLDPVTLSGLAYLRLRLDALARSIPLGAPWEAEHARRLDRQTLDNWMRRARVTAGPRDLMRIAVQVSWGCEPEEISMLHVLHYLRGTGGLEAMLAVQDGAQELHLDEGAQELSLRIAAELGDRVVLGSPVAEVEWGEGAGVLLRTDTTIVRARRAIFALSPAMRGRIRFAPHLPAPWREVPHHWFQGPVSKVYALYDRPFWREDGLSGEAIGDAGPIRVTLDAGSPKGESGILLGFVAADSARAWDSLAPAERRAQALGCFASFFGERALGPVEYLDHRWAEEPWTGGGSVSAAGPLAWTNGGRGIATPIGTIHWAGTETAGRWAGFLEGAVRSGERVAGEVTAALGASLVATA